MSGQKSGIQNSPVMQQYQEIKRQYPHFLLFFRMGDFYELFAEDAQIAAEILGITLTQRRTAQEQDGVPMCGVPFHAVEAYLPKVLDAGHRVALCEQVETPEEAKARGGAKALVRRAVVRLYTGGTLIEDSFLPADRAAVLAAVAQVGGEYALGWLDIAGAASGVLAVTKQTLTAELAALQPAEVLLTQHLAHTLRTQLQPYAQTVDERVFHPEHAQTALADAFAGAVTVTDYTPAAQLALGAVLAYARQTQVGRLPALRPPQTSSPQHHLVLDEITRRHLELVVTLKGEKHGSLLWAIDRTATKPGSRLLRSWLMQPSRNVGQIHARQAAMQALQLAPQAMPLQQRLQRTADLTRALSRIGLERAGPRDLGILRQTLGEFPQIVQMLQEIPDQPKFLHDQQQALVGFDALHNTLAAALMTDNIPHLVREGGFIVTGYDEELDTQRGLSSNGLHAIQTLEADTKAATGLSTLKIKYNKVWGYFLEVSAQQAKQVPGTFIHRQTTSNAQRFTTPELMDLERKLSAADALARQREQEIFQQLCQQVNQVATKLLDAALALATLDVLLNGALLAHSPGYCWPTVTTGGEFAITRGRHPVVAQTETQFVPNDCQLSQQQLWLLTGPNMAGKSTFLRQNALIALLAHMGFPVPADAATIGVVDRIFSRMGAADDLSRGQSTFMVEMSETAEILHNAGPHSLVILDEIGRGTATYDGLAIAWACVEHLALQCQCRGLFATHYHELTSLAQTLPTVSAHHVTVKEWQGDIVFEHTVQAGAAPRSYGIHVAKLAGLPTAAVQRAQEILAGLEVAGTTAKPADLPLFTAPATAAPVPAATPSVVQDKLLHIDLDQLSPREAQNLLYDLKIAAALG